MEGLVIPAHPLAVTENRTLDERSQRGITRYYCESGAGGIAVGVHTTQFAIREHGLFKPVLELAAITARDSTQTPTLIAGVCGEIDQAVMEATVARELGYDAILLSPGGLQAHTDAYLLERTKAVGEILPVIGFYLQTAVGGRSLNREYWRKLFDLECVAGVKVAPFNRYQTIEVVQARQESGHESDIALYTGNDDNIIFDLLGPFVGGLLGQWAVGTKCAVELLGKIKRCKQLGSVPFDIVRLANDYTDLNSAIFDTYNGFNGCIAGINEVLMRQGLMKGNWCLDSDEVLSKGQSEVLDKVMSAYPHLLDHEFVTANRDRWLS